MPNAQTAWIGAYGAVEGEVGVEMLCLGCWFSGDGGGGDMVKGSGFVGLEDAGY